MKVFFAVLFAILLAAIIIGGVLIFGNAQYSRLERAAESSAMQRDTAIREEQTLWMTATRNNKQLDPDASMLRARLREIHEAFDAGRPIPPSPFSPRASELPSKR